MSIDVRHDTSDNRFVIEVDGKEAGFAAYEPSAEFRNFNHTVIDAAFRGQGLSKPLIEAALNQTREEGLKVRPSCSAVSHFIQKNEAFNDLVV